MSFENTSQLDLRDTIINNSGRDQTNYFNIRQAGPRSSNRSRVNIGSSPMNPDGEGPRPWTEKLSNSPAPWTPSLPEPQAWTVRRGEPSQPRVPRQAPAGVLPRVLDNSAQPRQSHIRSSPRTVTQRTQTNRTHASILHTTKLPKLDKFLDQALAHTIASSPWRLPVAWTRADAKYIDSIIQDIAIMTDNEEIKQTLFTGKFIVYPRLVVYIYVHLMHCVRDERLLNEFKEYLGIWKTWDNITVIQNHQQIKDYLRNLFQIMQSVPDLHSEKLFQKLLVYDVTGLAAHLTRTVTDDNEYKKLVVRTDEEAQSLVNLLYARQELWIHPEFKSRHAKTLVKLSRSSTRYPDRLVLKGVEIKGHPVASGGFGDVYKGKFENHDLAVKVLKIKKRREVEKLRKEFSCEAVTWRLISHPNVLPFYGVYHLDTAGSPGLCLVSPWMKNGDLVHYLAEVAPKTDCVLLSLDIAQGLQHLQHGEHINIVHGDLKGHNILISASGRACIADLGLAAVKDLNPVDMTKTTARCGGTMQWRAPELLQDDGPNTNASDVYAFAMVCYEMFSGRYPFSNVNPFSFPSVLMKGERPSRPSDALSEIRGLNESMWDLMEACWSQLPEKRPGIDDIVQTLYLFPQRADDLRPMDDINITQLSSQMWHKQEHHPFFALSPVEDDNLNDDMRKLKWMSGDVDSYA